VCFFYIGSYIIFHYVIWSHLQICTVPESSVVDGVPNIWFHLPELFIHVVENSLTQRHKQNNNNNKKKLFNETIKSKK